jgi:hypothetical protein
MTISCVDLQGVFMVSLEEEMRNEMFRLEKEVDAIDDELEKLHNKIVDLIVIRKKKERDLRALRTNFGIEGSESDVQVTLERILKERYMKA